tara:strand:+ start:1043 stop:1246 length:204 start_codon:yes stop_codon:yes gene_type:complete
MVGNSNMRAKQKRAGALGQSSRLYAMKVGGTTKKVAGSQGLGLHNPCIGNMLSLKLRLLNNINKLNC